MKTYVLGGGCFWCLDSAFTQFRGIIDVEVGYSGGQVADPTYESVCSGITGHAEVAKVTFDETQISESAVLDIFFTLHDPTQLNRQGHDVGTQYRSSMFYADESQKQEFEAAIERAVQVWPGQVVTEISPLGDYWPAEEYHQNFFAKNPNQGYCLAVVLPKVIKVRKAYSNLLRES
ncbi:MAG: peptide-methionine (S)-S-oxide reductase MsrA [Actinomycetota bacterium]|jgi:peptide-methionine (S)-S-oxide reductase